MAAKLIPDGYHTLTPILTVGGAASVIDFVKRAFGAEEIDCYAGPGNTVMHAEIKIGDSTLMLADAGGEAPRPASLYLYVDDVDATYERALVAGALSLAEPADQFYGSRVARIEDSAGNRWAIATHKEDVPRAELHRRFENLMRPQAETV